MILRRALFGCLLALAPAAGMAAHGGGAELWPQQRYDIRVTPRQGREPVITIALHDATHAPAQPRTAKASARRAVRAHALPRPPAPVAAAFHWAPGSLDYWNAIGGDAAIILPRRARLRSALA